MTWGITVGILLTLLAGVMAGNCMLPLKFVRKWAWENTWLVFSLVSLLVLPWGIALSTVRDLSGVYASLTMREWMIPVLFGFGWGIAQAMFGLSVARLGLALAYAIIIGLVSLLGTLVPLVVQHREVIGTERGGLIFTGLAVMLAGIVVSGHAGRARERATSGEKNSTNGYGAALLIAVICGFLGPMLNYSFAFGQDIARKAALMGTRPDLAGFAVWPVGLAGGLIPNLAYSVYRLNRNRTWNLFLGGFPDSAKAIAMAVLWMGAFAIYAMAAVYLGNLGTSVGWALFQIFMIMTANVSGMMTGEWRGAPQASKRNLWIGLTLLATATVVISLGNTP